jgi:DNA-binding MarR family transcriptional regulator
MRPQVERQLEILRALEEGNTVTQRALASRLGVAVGLANLYVKRMVRKGYIKIVGFGSRPSTRKRLQYVLTAKGLAEKTRLTYEHMTYTLSLYRRARQTLRESIALLPDVQRVALYGAEDAAELAYLTLKELGIEPAGVYADQAGGRFLGFPVIPVADLRNAELDAVIVATFDRPERHLEALAALGVDRAKLITLRRAVPAEAGAGAR